MHSSLKVDFGLLRRILAVPLMVPPKGRVALVMVGFFAHKIKR